MPLPDDTRCNSSILRFSLNDAQERALILDAIFYEVPSLRILQGAYLKVMPGQICGIFGRNGSGKTTLLKVAAGQIRPASGLVIIDGERFAAPQRRRRFAKLAYLPQTPMMTRPLAGRCCRRSSGVG